MKIGFDNILDHVVTLEHTLHGRWFADPTAHKIHPAHITLLQPLDKPAAKFLWDFISGVNLHAQVPFKKAFFKTVIKAEIKNNNQEEIKKWLYRLAVPFDKPVYLSWQPDDAMIVPWKMIVRYYDELVRGVDDLTIVDASLNWAVLFYHEGEVFFGTNSDYELTSEMKEDEINFF